MPDSKKKQIMVVDDEVDIRDILETILTNEGYDVVTAESGPVCIEKLKKAHPDMILLDIFMYPWDGWKTLELIKSNRKTMGIPVSMLTVVPLTIEDFKNKPEDRKKFVYLENYLVKPVKKDELLRAVRDIIEMDTHLKGAVKTLKENGEEDRAKQFEKAARNLHRNRKLKNSLVKCLLDETRNIERVRKVIELQDRNIDLSLMQIRALESKYKDYEISGWETKKKDEKKADG